MVISQRKKNRPEFLLPFVDRDREIVRTWDRLSINNTSDLNLSNKLNCTHYKSIWILIHKRFINNLSKGKKTCITKHFTRLRFCLDSRQGNCKFQYDTIISESGKIDEKAACSRQNFRLLSFKWWSKLTLKMRKIDSKFLTSFVCLYWRLLEHFGKGICRDYN